MSLLLHNRSSFFSVYIVLPGLNPLVRRSPGSGPVVQKQTALCFMTAFVRYCKSFSAFSSSCGQNSPAVGSGHALAETVLISSFPLWRLERSFHGCLFYSSFLKQERKFSVNFFLFKDVFGSSSWLMVHSSWPEGLVAVAVAVAVVKLPPSILKSTSREG